MKRFLSVFLSLATTLCCLALPASAAEGDLFPAVKAYEGFEDVGDDWFAPYVELCVETGLMNGVGGGRFDPQGEVTCAQAVTLAARVHAARKVGDGTLPEAPAEWGTLKVEFENGTVLTFDSTQYRLHPVPMSAVLGASVSEEQMAQLDWFGLEDQVPAKVTAYLAETVGPYSAKVYWNGERGAMRFQPDYENASEEEQDAFRKMGGSLSLLYRPPVGDWLRDTVCYLEKAGLADQLAYFTRNGDRAASRVDFIDCLNAVSEGLLTPINEITDYPDSSNQHPKDMVLAFYNAGILTGKDEYGTFDPEGTLTRAECAAMLSRLVRPELRLTFQPKVMPEKYSYSLTYLMDDPMASHTVTWPVLPIITGDGQDNGILTLDGTLLPFPGDGTEPVSMYPNGYGTFFMSFWFTQADGTKVEKGGVMDESGTFVVPLTAGCYSGWDLEDGRYVTLSGSYEGEATLWDQEGHATALGVMDFEQVVEQYPNPKRMEKGLDVRAWGNYYAEENGHPVSEEFDWVGDLMKDGRGFVGLDGKVYRIQFTEARTEEPSPSGPDAAFVPFQEGELYGLKDAGGNVVIPAQYAYLALETDGAVVVTDHKGNKGILDTEGNVVLPCLYPRVYNSPDKLGLVVVGTAGDYASPLHYNGKKGMIDCRGTIIIPLEYDFLTPFEDGQASFMRGEVFGHLLPDGTEAVLTAEEVPEDDLLYPLLAMYGMIQ